VFRPLKAVIRMMVARDPMRTVDAILEFLIGVNDAAEAAVFSLNTGVRLFVGRGIGEEAGDWTREQWQREHARLSEGRFSRSDDRILVPVLRGERAVALLYLKAPAADMESLSEVMGAIADAVGGHHVAPASAVETYLEHAPSEEIERRRLVILLDRFEWNVARVARELRVTRTTVYKRLVEFRIQRKHVRKSGGSSRVLCPTLVSEQ